MSTLKHANKTPAKLDIKIRVLISLYFIYLINKDIPIYGIMFGSANDNQLLEISKYTGGKVFDGRTNLLEAFKEVRGYN